MTKYSKGKKSGSSRTKSDKSVPQIGPDLTDDLSRVLGPDSNGDVAMAEMGLEGDETKEEDHSTIAATALVRGTVPASKYNAQVQSHTVDQGARTRPSRPQTYSCRACDKPDNDNMIMCDDHAAHQSSGEAWFHYACVGLRPDTLRPEVWYCPPCEDEKIFRAFG